LNNRQRIVLTRLVVSSALLFFLLRFFEYTTPSRMQSPPLFNLDLDLTYWLYKLSGLSSLLVGNRIAAVLSDILLVGTGLLTILQPLKRIWIIGFSILIILYAMAFSTFSLGHTVAFYGLIVTFLPFWIGGDEKFSLAWEGIRYYTCFIYFAAFIWKTCIGDAFFYWQQGSGSFRYNLVEYLYHNPSTSMAGLYRWFITHDWALNMGHVFIILLEGLMGTGLFTKKYDRILFWLPFIIHITTYFFADVFIFELMVLNFAFLTGRQLTAISRKFPVLIYPQKHVLKTNQEDLSLTP
jgi:hypothetical protein